MPQGILQPPIYRKLHLNGSPKTPTQEIFYQLHLLNVPYYLPETTR
jgi:hypothetical protein